MSRVSICFLFSLTSAIQAYTQQFSYTDREFYFDRNREQMRIIAAPGDLLHLWKYGLNGVSLSTYTRDLGYLATKTLSGRVKNVTFIHYTSFYYAILSDSADVEIYFIENDGTYRRIPNSPELTHLTGGGLYSYYFRKGTSNLFIIRQANDLDSKKTLWQITAVDSNLKYINKIALEVEYITGKTQQIMLSAVDDQLLLLHHTYSNGAEVLAINKIDVAKGTFFTKLFHPEGLKFISHQLLLSGNDIILQSQVEEVPQKEQTPRQFSYFIKMNRELQAFDNVYLNSPPPTQSESSSYLYKPVVTVTLPNKELLAIDFGRKEQKKAKGPEEVLRFTWLDSNLTVVKIIDQPADKGQYIPSFLLINEKRIHFFYEEAINKKNKIISSYEMRYSVVNEKPLLLTPTYNYDLKGSIPISGSIFVMPYIHNFRSGLVKVNMGGG